MNSENFFQRWKNLNKYALFRNRNMLVILFFLNLYLNSPGQEAQKIFKSKYPMESDNPATKLSGFGFQLLENVDPNPENYVCAAIFHSRLVQVGCLLRLEPNKQAQVCKSIFTLVV